MALEIHYAIKMEVRKYQVSAAWQSTALLPISCKSVQPVPARLEEPVSLVKAISGGVIP